MEKAQSRHSDRETGRKTKTTSKEIYDYSLELVVKIVLKQCFGCSLHGYQRFEVDYFSVSDYAVVKRYCSASDSANDSYYSASATPSGSAFDSASLAPAFSTFAGAAASNP